jgi:hypothetical protein
LQNRLRRAWQEAEAEQAVLHVERLGTYIEFASEPGFDLVVTGLERLQSGIRLLNVREEMVGDLRRTLATVYVPNNRRAYFLRKIEAYAQENTPRNRPKNAKLVESISDIRRAVVESFWRAEERDLMPAIDPDWVEVWLSSDTDDVIERFDLLLREMNVEVGEGLLKFPERAVMLVRVNREQLNRLTELSDDIAEFRGARRLASFFLELENEDQLEVVQQILGRTSFATASDVAVCILDGGVNNVHLLLQPVLNDVDLHAANPAWNVNDDDGHGTLMAGTAAFGDLLSILNHNGRVQVNHRLESAKILPPPPVTNPKMLWGHMMVQGISRAEIEAPDRKRIACMAVTSIDDRDRGRPSSWSATVDEFTSGYADDIHRLMVISAGNTQPEAWRNYPADNLTNEVHDPAQSWNALTVGAFTEKTQIVDATLEDYLAIAPSGGLSPYSTTSLNWPARKWPIKPEVLFEGGNVASGPNDSILDADELQLLSTYYDPQVAQFASFSQTSAAAAQAAWMAARIQTEYPTATPETVRGLIIHTAAWTEAMNAQFLPAAPSRGDYAELLRICGYGVPNLQNALYCARNSLTLIAQAELQPYSRENGRYVTNEMHLYDLPWPTEVLAGLAETVAEMRVTLSYFVEPGPGEVGWENRYRYASHGLRFQINGPQESEEDFVQRVNRQAREEREHPGTVGPGDRWVIGEARNVGSIHSDIWRGTCADLAESNLVAVYPTVGWWRERHHLNRWNRRCRYSLIVSIHTPTEDIYTPVAVQLGIAVPIEVNVGA